MTLAIVLATCTMTMAKWLAAPRILTVTTTSTRFLRERMTSRRVVSATMRLL